MAKQPLKYKCSSCNATTNKWAGCCLQCKAWHTLEENNTPAASPVNKAGGTPSTVYTLDNLPHHEATKRLNSGIKEWDRVMGGGLMPGAFIIVTGDPGIGKSTLLLQVAAHLAQHHSVLYFSSEESGGQLRQRAERLTLPHSDQLRFSDNADLSAIIATVEQEKPAVIILDSIQNCYLNTQERTTLPGSIPHLKQAGFSLMQLAKQYNIVVIVTGHITKEGQMAGPKLLEHIVDGVFYLKGEDRWHVRMLRAVKNRFGTIDELGFFEMSSAGMQPLANINAHLLQHTTHAPGAALTCSLEGTRPLLLEIQALCVATKFSMPQRVVTGLDQKRVLLIAAILEKYLHVNLSSFDIFCKVSGGCSIKESASDVALALALLSSFFQHPLPEKSIALGEISLTGQIKPISYCEPRLKEAETFGMTHYFMSREQQQKPARGTVTQLSTVMDLLTLFPAE